MSKIYLFLGLLFSLNVSATSELTFEKIIFNRDDAELSGLLQHNNELLFVADKLSNRAIYKVRFENDRFFYTNHLDISKLQGHNSYFAKALLFKHAGRILKSPFDLEGLTYCKDNYYLANEQARHVLKVNKQSVTRLDIKFEEIFKKLGAPLEKISTNAGFEGISIDCKNQILYIAQERQPRAIIVIDLKTNTPTDIFQTEASKESKITPSYADIHYEGGYLYLLERNAHLITKIDAKTKKVISKYKFGKTKNSHLKEIYDTGEPYGLAEGLAMDESRIYIAVDNNKNKLTKKEAEAEAEAVKAEDELKIALKQEIGKGLVQVSRDKDKVIVTVGSGGAFRSGSADLTEEAQSIMKRIAGTNSEGDSEITVSGHTDDVPLIFGSRYRDNWDLAAARSASVVQSLSADNLIKNKRLEAISYGESRPLETNDTAAGRAKNRRIEIEINY